MPTAIIAKTIKGKGVSFMEDDIKWHGRAMTDEEYKKAIEELTKDLSTKNIFEANIEEKRKEE